MRYVSRYAGLGAVGIAICRSQFDMYHDVQDAMRYVSRYAGLDAMCIAIFRSRCDMYCDLQVTIQMIHTSIAFTSISCKESNIIPLPMVCVRHFICIQNWSYPEHANPSWKVGLCAAELCKVFLCGTLALSAALTEL